MVLPRTFSGRNSRGELPKSKSTPPVCSARRRSPLRSPASSTSGRSSRMASASGISDTGMTASAPLASAVIMVVVARKISSTTHAVRLRSRSANAENSGGENSTSMLRVIATTGISFSQFYMHPRVVKQVLLRIAPPRPETCRRKLLQPFQRHPPPRKVQSAQRLHHPDIHRERVLKTAGKQQNAIRNLPAHARQPHQRRPRLA